MWVAYWWNGFPNPEGRSWDQDLNAGSLFWEVIPGNRNGRLRKVKQVRRESQSQGALSSWSLLWASGAHSYWDLLRGYMVVPQNCLSEGQKINSSNPIYHWSGATPMGCWISLASSSTHVKVLMVAHIVVSERSWIRHPGTQWAELRCYQITHSWILLSWQWMG